MNDKIMFFVINEEGIREDAQILAKYKLSNGNNYITYTYNEINDNNMIKIYSINQKIGVPTTKIILPINESAVKKPCHFPHSSQYSISFLACQFQFQIHFFLIFLLKLFRQKKYFCLNNLIYINLCHACLTKFRTSW